MTFEGAEPSDFVYGEDEVVEALDWRAVVLVAVGCSGLVRFSFEPIVFIYIRAELHIMSGWFPSLVISEGESYCGVNGFDEEFGIVVLIDASKGGEELS